MCVWGGGGGGVPDLNGVNIPNHRSIRFDVQDTRTS